MSRIFCVSVLNRDGSVFFQKQFNGSIPALKMNVLIYRSIPRIDEKLKAAKPPFGKAELFGLIAEDPEALTFAYRAPLGYQILVVVDAKASPPEPDVKEFCERVKDIVFDAITDPFYRPFASTQSPRFIGRLDTAVEAFNPL